MDFKSCQGKSGGAEGSEGYAKGEAQSIIRQKSGKQLFSLSQDKKKDNCLGVHADFHLALILWVRTKQRNQ